MKVVKRVIVGVLVAALAAGGIYTGLMHVKESKVTEVPVTSVSNLQTDWYSETTLDGTITTNVSQNVNMDKDMIIEKIYVSQGDDVKKGDNLISFDMTLVEMELNIAKLKQQKQEQDLTKAQNRLTSLQNGGPIEDSTDSTDDTDLNLTGGDTGGDGEMTNTDTPSGSDGDEDMQSTTGSAATADGSYLADDHSGSVCIFRWRSGYVTGGTGIDVYYDSEGIRKHGIWNSGWNPVFCTGSLCSSDQFYCTD